MRKILLLLLAWFVVSGGISYAQRTAVKLTPQKQNKVAQDITQNAPLRKCGTMEYLAKQEAENPSLIQSRLDFEEFTENWIKNNQEYLNNENKAVVTIPVVVHVVGTATVQNFAIDARVTEQITILNTDYAGQNTHSMASFATNLKANTELQFCLAQRKPDGTATNGINRVTTTTSTYSTNNLVKTHAPAWDPTKYMNIWVCNLGTSLCGYAQFPSSGINSTYGVVIHYNYFGLTGSTGYPYNLGATTTHEIGHCFNLYHIWGDDGGSCSGTDYCTDTPNQADANYDQWTGVHTDACTTTSPGIMYMNFMDYSPDITMSNFTPNQKVRIQALFASGGALYSMTQNNLGCVPPGGTSVPTVTTTAASAITNTTATSGGNVTADGGATVTARGICFATTQNPTTSNTVVNSGTGTGTFTSNLTGLTLATTYYVRAFATNTNGTAYGNQVTFTTTGGTTTGCDTTNLMTSGLPWYSFACGNNSYGDLAKANYYASSTSGQTIQDIGVDFIYAVGTTGTATISVWSNAGANGSPGTVLGSKTVTLSTISTDVNNATTTWIHLSSPVTLSGPCYVGVTLPTVAGDTAVILADTSATFSYNVAWEQWDGGLWYTFNDPNVDSWGIAAALGIYPIICDPTTTVTVPTLTTSAATTITNTTATCGGNVTSDGGGTVTARGVCWGTSTNPLVTGLHTTNGTGTGTFTSNLTGLTTNTTYFARAYATNSAGTAYGNQITFTTTSVGIDVTGLDQAIKIYPNPSSSNVYINLGKYSIENVNVYVYDALGKEIIVDKKINSEIVTYNFTNQSNGLYFIYVSTPDGNIVKKISINK